MASVLKYMVPYIFTRHLLYTWLWHNLLMISNPTETRIDRIVAHTMHNEPLKADESGTDADTDDDAGAGY